MGRTKNLNPKRCQVPTDYNNERNQMHSIPTVTPIHDAQLVQERKRKRRIELDETDDDIERPMFCADEFEDISIMKDNQNRLPTQLEIHDENGFQRDVDRYRILLRRELKMQIALSPLLRERIRKQSYVIGSTAAATCLLTEAFESSMPKDFSTVGIAIQEDIMVLELDWSNVPTLFIYLTLKAYQVASTQEIPAFSRNLSKKHHSLQNLRLALADLFPNTIVSSALEKSSQFVPAQVVYEAVDNFQLQKYEQHFQETNLKDMKIDGLVPTLRPYQQAAVQWMLRRERGDFSHHEWELVWVVLLESGEVHPLDRSRATNGVIYSPYSGWLVTSYCDAQMSTSPLAPVRGGILAESMGLGKTVEVLACILANPFIPCHERNSVNSLRVESAIDEPTFNSTITASDAQSARVTLMTENCFGPCFCGVEHPFKGCLGFVVCDTCRNPMHGLCAGFSSLEQVNRETMIEQSLEGNTEQYSNKNVDQFSDIKGKGYKLIRRCSRKRCPSCAFMEETDKVLESRATIIVTPAAIISQWEREIEKHIHIRHSNTDETSGEEKKPLMANHLVVKTYPGIKALLDQKHRSSEWSKSLQHPDCHLVHAQFLADADIVLTTFDALMSDLKYSDENPFARSGPSGFRRRKRYRVIPSPLLNIKWWRVCLDEAQRIEAPTATSARMASKLITEHRWCVTGTPIRRGKLDDLYGLLLFLKLEPFVSKSWFKLSLQAESYGIQDRVRQLLQHILWRSTKSNESVRLQLGIPPQVEKKVILSFSTVERHFYERQLERTLVAVTDVLNTKRSKKHEIACHQLHRLRAACCHPQVGSTGLGLSKKKRKINHDKSLSSHASSPESGVLTMEQILDRLIDETKLQCEESQRLAVMHANAMAALWRLKVDAKQQGCVYQESDEKILRKSCELYLESLNLTEENATPAPALGEAHLTGCSGFMPPSRVVREGRSILLWKVTKDLRSNLWAQFDFEGTYKKISKLRVRTVKDFPTDFVDANAQVVYPNRCSFQVSHSSLGGEFVNVVSFNLDKTVPKEDLIFDGFRTNKSKVWRIVVESVHDPDLIANFKTAHYYLGLEVDLFEPDIASDSIQRLHVLHNAVQSMSLLEQVGSECGSSEGLPNIDYLSRIHDIQKECDIIESLYLDSARAFHSQIKRELEIASTARENSFLNLKALNEEVTRRKIKYIWQDAWWDDILSNCYINGTSNERMQLCSRVQNEIEQYLHSSADMSMSAKANRMNFPRFQDVDGLQTALTLRMDDFLSKPGKISHVKCMEKFANLSPFPSIPDQLENSSCHKCHMDWNQTGPECKHCKLETELLNLDPEPLILGILNAIWKWWLDLRQNGKLWLVGKAAKVTERAEKFFEIIKYCEKERQRAKKAWRIHLDLLNDIDEVNQCKMSMRLAAQGEDLTVLSKDELNAVVLGVEIPIRIMDHDSKQAMALGSLRRQTQTLRYLKNQNKEIRAKEASSCIVCLTEMTGERAFLACGHSFHEECMKSFLIRRNNQSTITCPLRCTITTAREKIMLASDFCNDDGTLHSRNIKGSWGTKVTHLVCELINVSEKGEKSIVFSQWEDMLWIAEHALIANSVNYVRVVSMKKIGEYVQKFRSSNCNVMLLNVKNGAEGLTLVEATHVFMIEPLLNSGLDSQAISRIHRIGQTRTTYVHRFLLQDTIEMKIDKMRSDRDENEDSVLLVREKSAIEGGGIDGGFSQEELIELLQ
jgi:SNF2 family DNA or RNA helicase